MSIDTTIFILDNSVVKNIDAPTANGIQKHIRMSKTNSLKSLRQLYYKFNKSNKNNNTRTVKTIKI